MGLRLVESVKLSYGSPHPRWDFSLAGAAVLFDGEGYAVCGDIHDQPEGPQFIWAGATDEPQSELQSGYSAAPESASGWTTVPGAVHFAPAAQAEL